MSVNENGVTDITGNPTPFYVRRIKFQNNLIFDSDGRIINPETRTLLGTCPGIVSANAFVPDTATGRVLYAIKESPTTVTIKACDINTFTYISSPLIIPNAGSETIPSTLVRYGTNGLAMRTLDNRIYLIQTALIPTQNPLPTPTGTPTTTPTPTPAVYARFMRQVTLPNKDLIYSPTEQKFYASVPGTAPAPRANSVTRINPANAAIENSVAVGTNPGRLGLSGDDQTLYVGIDGANAVRKFDVATQTPGLQFPLGSGSGGPRTAHDIDVLPDNPNAVAVSYGNGSYNYDGADIYDEGVRRAQRSFASGSIQIASPSTLYVGEYYLYKFGIGANGLSLQGNFSTSSGGEAQVVNNVLYTSSGGVIDLATTDFRGSFQGVGYWSALTVDVPNNRAFFLVNEGSMGGSGWSIKAFRLDNFLPAGNISLPGMIIYNQPRRLLRWGENGLAFTDNNDKIYFIQSDLVSVNGTVPTALQLSSQAYNSNENSGSLLVTIVRSGGLTGTTSVDYTTVDGTATAGTDYTATVGTLVFAPGEASKTIDIPIINDNVYEGTESFSFLLSNAGGGGGGTVEIQTPSTAVLTINDNDNQPFTSTANISVNEPRNFGTTTALFTVQLSNPTTQMATVNYATADGTATAGSDYIATSGTLTFAPLETTKTIAVQILADQNYNEPNETFRINFSNAVNVWINTFQVTATIINYNPQTARHVQFDFDDDGRSDTSVFRPSNGVWYGTNSSNNTVFSVSFGQAGDLIAPADFDGDMKTDIAVFRPENGTWYRLNSSNGQFVSTQFGQLGDKPQVADFDGDLKSDVAVWRPSNGSWYILRSSTGTFFGTGFGQTGDIPTPMDYDGDGRSDLSVFRPSSGHWYRLNSSNNQFVSAVFGATEDIPVAADYDGDGRADLAVFRPSNGTWYLQRSTQGFTGIQFGQNGDIPTPSAFGQ